MVGIGAVYLTLRNGGIDWATHWTAWAVIIILSILGALFAAWGIGGLAAGAEWVRYGKEWVKAYELTDVKLGEPRSPSTLVLEDTDGRKFSLGLMSLQANPALWDLVYNGMVHSIYYNRATVNERAREKLILVPQCHFIYDDDLPL
jgi:hypothetical protein